MAAVSPNPRFRVLLLFSRSLLVSGIEAVLREHKVLAEVTRVDVGERDTADVIRHLRDTDIVILDSRDSAAQRILTMAPLTDAIVISINPGENVIEVYRKERMTIAKLSDLSDVVKAYQA